MIGHVIIEETGATPGISKREQGRITKEVLEGVAENHHRRYMRKHFTIAGGREYGYKPRKGEGLSGKAFWQSYTGKKKKQKGHQRPLVWSGASEQLARVLDVRANSKRARLVQHARGLNRRSRHSDIRMYQEISAVSQAEIRTAVDLAGQLMQKKYQAIQTTKTTRL
jgi:hypothetical protein